MPRLETALVVLLAMPTAAFASTEPSSNLHEARASQRQLAVDRNWNERDAREISDFEQLTKALKDACEDRMSGRYREVNRRVQAAITREIRQSQVKSAQDAHEVNQSRGELRNERMEASTSGDASDLFQVQEDRRDLRDDLRDSQNSTARYQEMARLGTISASLQNAIERGDQGAMKRNVELAGKFLDMMRRDMAADLAELHEDRGEMRDDRGERQTGRR